MAQFPKTIDEMTVRLKTSTQKPFWNVMEKAVIFSPLLSAHVFRNAVMMACMFVQFSFSMIAIFGWEKKIHGNVIIFLVWDSIPGARCPGSLPLNNVGREARWSAQSLVV